MPFYEYECSNCKFYVEVLQKISEEPLRKCPSCKKQAMKKLVSAPVFRLKGAGWYETDFKNDGEDKRNLADRDEPASEKADEAKPAADVKVESTEKKPEAKPSEVKTGSGARAAAGKKAAAKAAPAKGKKAAPAKAPAKRPAAKKSAPAKKKAKRR